MDDSGVVAGLVGSDPVFFFQHDHARAWPPADDLPADRQPDDAGNQKLQTAVADTIADSGTDLSVIWHDPRKCKIATSLFEDRRHAAAVQNVIERPFRNVDLKRRQQYNQNLVEHLLEQKSKCKECGRSDDD